MINDKNVYAMQEINIIEEGKKAVEIETLGCQAVLNSINEDFVKLVDIIKATSGRVILSAIGKPGFVARKVAATLASTGTPSFFIHPDEASHGDLGMITKDDIVILLSNSGNTLELNDITAYCKRFNIPLIGITRDKDSFLAKSSDLPIILTNVQETNNVKSPTTSNLMFTVYLDALTTVLIKVKDFDNTKYKIFHPGGKLGASLIKIEDIMRKGENIPIVKASESVQSAVEEMSRKSCGGVFVVDENNKMIGIISDGDLRRKLLLYKNIFDKKITDIMTINPKFIYEDQLAIEAVNCMTEGQRYIQILPILNKNNEIVGILHIQDLFKARVI